MPTISTLLKVAFYWLLWLLIARRLLLGSSTGLSLSAIGWAFGAGTVTAWFTWIALHDDKQARLYGEDAESDDGPASPASRFASAVALCFGAFACFAIGALVAELRIALLLFGILALLAAAYVLFFGRKSSGTDVDYS